MSTVKQFKLSNDPIACHAFNGSLTQVAISFTTPEVYIFTVPKSATDKFIPQQILTEHTQTVTGIDWATKSDQLVTCSADRNAYVWTQDQSGLWKPKLVILSINRAATCVSWSPLENKFAVGSASRMIAVCHYEKSNDWWVSKHIKKPIRSTVTCLDWHPNNVLISCGSTDFRVRVFSAYMKSVDSQPAGTGWGSGTSFQSLLFETSPANSEGWVHCVAFSANGSKLAWVSHDSSLSIADSGSGSPPVVRRITLTTLPLTSIIWTTPDLLLGAGHECTPVLIKVNSNGAPEYLRQLEIGKGGGQQRGGAGSQISAMRKFQQIDRNATVDAVNTELSSIHQNAITQLIILRGTCENVEEASSVGKDGQLVMYGLSGIRS